MVHGGQMTIVPRDRDRVPTRSRDSAAISGITSPAYSNALPELLGFGSGHVALHCLRAGDGLPCILMIEVYDSSYRWPKGSPCERGIIDRKSTRLNSITLESRMPSSA